jgi:transaldolase
MNDLLEQLKSMTTIVADTGDIEAIHHHQPQDATTNPSLLLKAAILPEYIPLIEDSISWAKSQSTDPEQQTHDSMDKPRKLISLYNAAGISNDRVLIKIASTWEGIRAAELLEREGINCNLTLLFSFAQARACAEAGVTLISPFVGRILDWHKAKSGRDFVAEDDPGVQSVRKIYAYYKAHSFKTIVMGASFRNVGEILALAGCDRLTIAPSLLDELKNTQGKLERQLHDTGATEQRPEPMIEASFRWDMNEDAMATEKLAEGIRGFTVDQVKLEKMLVEKL